MAENLEDKIIENIEKIVKKGEKVETRVDEVLEAEFKELIKEVSMQ